LLSIKEIKFQKKFTESSLILGKKERGKEKKGKEKKRRRRKK